MEEQDKRVTQYLVPANVSARFEFFPGFGWYEFKIVIIACLIGTLIFFALGLFKKTIYVDANSIPIESTIGSNIDVAAELKIPYIPAAFRAFAILIPGAAAFFLVKKDPSSGLSLIYLYRCLKEFKSRQKLYLYKYGSGTEG